MVLLYVFEFHEAWNLVHGIAGGVHDVDEVLGECGGWRRALLSRAFGFTIGVSKSLPQRYQIVLPPDVAGVDSQSFEGVNHF